MIKWQQVQQMKMAEKEYGNIVKTHLKYLPENNPHVHQIHSNQQSKPSGQHDTLNRYQTAQHSSQQQESNQSNIFSKYIHTCHNEQLDTEGMWALRTQKSKYIKQRQSLNKYREFEDNLINIVNPWDKSKLIKNPHGEENYLELQQNIDKSIRNQFEYQCEEEESEPEIFKQLASIQNMKKSKQRQKKSQNYDIEIKIDFVSSEKDNEVNSQNLDGRCQKKVDTITIQNAEIIKIDKTNKMSRQRPFELKQELRKANQHKKQTNQGQDKLRKQQKPPQNKKIDKGSQQNVLMHNKETSGRIQFLTGIQQTQQPQKCQKYQSYQLIESKPTPIINSELQSQENYQCFKFTQQNNSNSVDQHNHSVDQHNQDQPIQQDQSHQNLSQGIQNHQNHQNLHVTDSLNLKHSLKYKQEKQNHSSQDKAALISYINDSIESSHQLVDETEMGIVTCQTQSNPLIKELQLKYTNRSKLSLFKSNQQNHSTSRQNHYKNQNSSGSSVYSTQNLQSRIQIKQRQRTNAKKVKLNESDSSSFDDEAYQRQRRSVHKKQQKYNSEVVMVDSYNLVNKNTQIEPGCSQITGKSIDKDENYQMNQLIQKKDGVRIAQSKLPKQNKLLNQKLSKGKKEIGRDSNKTNTLYYFKSNHSQKGNNYQIKNYKLSNNNQNQPRILNPHKPTKLYQYTNCINSAKEPITLNNQFNTVGQLPIKIGQLPIKTSVKSVHNQQRYKAKKINLKQGQNQFIGRSKLSFPQSPQNNPSSLPHQSLFYSQSKNKQFSKSPSNSNRSLQKITELQHEMMQKINHLQLMIKDLSFVRSDLHKAKQKSHYFKSIDKLYPLNSSQESQNVQIMKGFMNKRLEDNYNTKIDKKWTEFHRPLNLISNHQSNTQTSRNMNYFANTDQSELIQKRGSESISVKKYVNKKANGGIRLGSSQKKKEQKKSKVFEDQKVSVSKINKPFQSPSKISSSIKSSNQFSSKDLFAQNQIHKISILQQIRQLKSKVQALEDQKRKRREKKHKTMHQKNKNQKQIRENNPYQLQLDYHQKDHKSFKDNLSLQKPSPLFKNRQQFDGIIQLNNRIKEQAMVRENRQKRKGTQKIKEQNKNQLIEYPCPFESIRQMKKTQANLKPRIANKSKQLANQLHSQNNQHKLDSGQMINQQQVKNKYLPFNKGFNLQFLSKPFIRNSPSPQDDKYTLSQKALKIYKKLQQITNLNFSNINQLHIQKYDHSVTFQISPSYQGRFNIIWNYPTNQLTNQNSSLIYCGQWKQTFTNSKNSKSKHGQGIQIFQNTYFYKGTFRDNLKNGSGISYYLNGDIYLGEWKDNLMNGNGVYITFQGDVYQGNFINNKKNGYGVEKFRNGDYYKGFYRKGLFHGQGKYKWSNQSSYRGDFKKGHLHGKGVWKSEEGDSYEGDYFMDQKHGFGKYIWRNGRVYEGIFERGQNVSKHNKVQKN